MTLPFSPREFFELFGRYNQAVWPAQSVLYGIAVLIVARVIQQNPRRLTLVLVAVLWFWMGLVTLLVVVRMKIPSARTQRPLKASPQTSLP